MERNLLSSILKRLKETWDYTEEELQDIKDAILEFATCVILDSDVRKELDTELQNRYDS